jgi:dihydrofolate reductase
VTKQSLSFLKENTLRKVILMIGVSLDGFNDEEAAPQEASERPSAHEGRRDDATEDEWQDELEVESTVDTVFLGRRTYQGWRTYWPSVATDPSASKNERQFAHWIVQTSKLVFSQTLETVDWHNTRLMTGQIAEGIARLKQQPGQNLLLFGGPGLARTFMQANLIDEYRIKFHPMISGRGQPLWQEMTNRIPLQLQTTKVFTSGVVLHVYQACNGG